MTESRLPAWGYVTVWEFRVRPEAFEVFERIYGPDGDWVRLFQTAEGYVTTELNRDLRQAGRYVTLDFWTSREAHLRFKEAHAHEYAALDAACEHLTIKETALGEFERLRGKLEAQPD